MIALITYKRRWLRHCSERVPCLPGAKPLWAEGSEEIFCAPFMEVALEQTALLHHFSTAIQCVLSTYSFSSLPKIPCNKIASFHEPPIGVRKACARADSSTSIEQERCAADPAERDWRRATKSTSQECSNNKRSSTRGKVMGASRRWRVNLPDLNRVDDTELC